MRSGPLRHRVVLEEPVVTQSNTGVELVTWTPLREVSAEMAPDKGREGATNDAIRDSRTVVWRIRWAPDLQNVLTAKWRIRHGSMVYNIQSPDPMGRSGRKQMIELVCTIGVNNG
jgi:SPP1 family predicted phage head-tail adaptor